MQLLSQPRMFECSASLRLRLKAAVLVVDREKHFFPQKLDGGGVKLTAR